MTVRTIFSINIKHEFFHDTRCRDLYIQPSRNCEVLLKKHNLYFRHSENGLASVFLAQNETDDLSRQSDTSLDFTFLLFLKDNTFLAYTHLPEKNEDDIFCFSNNGSDHEEASALNTTLIKKALVTSITDSMLFGIIKITLTSNFIYSAVATARKCFTVNFKAAGVYWKYYILANGSRRNVEIDGSLAGLEFERKDDIVDSTWKSLVANFPNEHLMLYQSKSKVACSDRGIRNIRLLNADNKSVLVSHLPTPCFSDGGIKILNAGML